MRRWKHSACVCLVGITCPLLCPSTTPMSSRNRKEAYSGCIEVPSRTTLHWLHNFACTISAWHYWVVYDLAYLLKDLEKDDPSTEALRFLYNWITYVDYLVFDLKIEDDIKIRLCHLRPWVHARTLKDYKAHHGSSPDDTYSKIVNNWRTTAKPAATTPVAPRGGWGYRPAIT